MPPVEAYQKVLISSDFTGSIHGSLGCSYCHGGNPEKDTFQEAHLGLQEYSLDRAKETCGACHGDIVASVSGTLKMENYGGIKMERYGGGKHPLMTLMIFLL